MVHRVMRRSRRDSHATTAPNTANMGAVKKITSDACQPRTLPTIAMRHITKSHGLLLQNPVADDPDDPDNSTTHNDPTTVTRTA